MCPRGALKRMGVALNRTVQGFFILLWRSREYCVIGQRL